MIDRWMGSASHGRSTLSLERMSQSHPIRSWRLKHFGDKFGVIVMVALLAPAPYSLLLLRDGHRDAAIALFVAWAVAHFANLIMLSRRRILPLPLSIAGTVVVFGWRVAAIIGGHTL